jgi:acid phosphatase
VVVIYAENRSFDGLYGNFPGANGLSAVVDANGNPTAAYVKQLDRDGTVLAKLPQTWGGATAAGVVPAVSQAQTDGLANAPFSIETGFTASSGVTLDANTTSRDMYHRFFEEQMQDNGGKMDHFTAWADSGGLVMGHWDYSKSAMYALAKQYTLADNWFNGAFGGSFLNHQYLICACAPVAPADFVTNNKATVNTLGAATAAGVPQLAANASSPASALTGPPSLQTGNIAPKDYFGSGDGYRAVNTMQSSYQPSGNAPVDTNGNDLLYANPGAASTLPPQTQTTIGDLLNGAFLSWSWYSGSWNAAVADGRQDPTIKRTVIYAPSSARAAPDFQPHHQPFNYYAEFDPGTSAGAANRAAHLKDYTDLVSDAKAGTLPTVTFFKPQGNYNQHPGYANLIDGDQHLADLISKLQASPQWPGMLIIVTYDEFGGQWDHVGPPKGDLLGPGARIPTVLISPLVKQGFVDHTQYDSGSINRFLIKRFGLDGTRLPGLAARDKALTSNGGQAMGDLSNALQ